jgi:hypothetical protein
MVLLLRLVCCGCTQFRWLQLQHPEVVLAAERLLFATCPIMGSVVQTWGIASATGAENAPFYLMCLSAGYYYLFSVPTKSSFVFKVSLQTLMRYFKRETTTR